MTRTVVDIRSFRRRFRSGDFYSVRLDDGEEMVVHEETRVKCRLRIGMEIDNTLADHIQREEQRLEALEKAMRLLRRRPHSAAELRTKMTKDRIPPAMADEVIGRLVSGGLVQDDDFAWRYARALLKRKRIGARHVRQSLQKKGISSETVAAILKELVPEETQYQSALELARKKRRSYRQGDERVLLRKLSAFLMQRGFPPELIRRVLSEVIGRDAEDAPPD